MILNALTFLINWTEKKSCRYHFKWCHLPLRLHKIWYPWEGYIRSDRDWHSTPAARYGNSPVSREYHSAASRPLPSASWFHPEKNCVGYRTEKKCSIIFIIIKQLPKWLQILISFLTKFNVMFLNIKFCESHYNWAKDCANNWNESTYTYFINSWTPFIYLFNFCYLYMFTNI